jgi:hypothetical protein
MAGERAGRLDARLAGKVVSRPTDTDPDEMSTVN